VPTASLASMLFISASCETGSVCILGIQEGLLSLYDNLWYGDTENLVEITMLWPKT